MTRLFKRSYELQVDTLRTSSLDIAFDVERTLRRRPNRAEVKVWNLTQDHRRQLERLERGHVFVRLEAGYEDEQGRGLIFQGELSEARSERSGADIVTTIKSRDGHAAHGARVSSSHTPGTSLGSVFSTLAGAMGVGEGNIDEVLPSASMSGVSEFDGGATLSGSAGDELDRLCDSAGLEWSIQDGALQLLTRGGALTREAVRLASSTGLLGTPSIDEHGKLKIRTLLIPQIVPGCLVRVESEEHEGTYRVEKAAYKGETASDVWGIEALCAEVAA